MNTFINYIIESGISLGVFTLIYWFILRRETKFKVTRFYLMFALVFSSLLPFFTISIAIPITNTVSVANTQNVLQHTNLLNTVSVFASGIPARISNVVLAFDYSMLLYGLGALAAIFVIAMGFFQLVIAVSKNRVFNLKNAHLVVFDKESSPYSFFNYIFIGKQLAEEKDWKTMIYHEVEHVKQGHSFDVLFVDVMMVFQWFNPFYWVIRRLMRENHEFLADTGVLQRGLISNARYKELLLAQAIGGSPIMSSNFLNVKTIKKRFKMITNNKNRKHSFLRYSLGVVAALFITLFFACEDTDNASISSSNDGNLIYLGEFTTMVELQEQNYSTLQIVKSDYLDVIAVYPELKGKIDADTSYLLAFDADDNVQKSLMEKLSFSDSENKIEQIDAVSYGKDQISEDEQVFVIVEDMPEYPGGELALRKFIEENVKYPEEAIAQGIEGKVYVTFVVSSDGSVKKARIARGVSTLLDAEALRVVNSLPAWKPGYQKGEAVAVTYTVPISFKLQ